MKKLSFLLSTLLLVFTLNSFAQEETKEVNPNAPVIVFESDEIDYGTIDRNSEPQRIIKFKNTGKSPLVITNCAGSCGCTVPQCPKDPIMPGQSGELKVKYDTNRVGPINKTVTVKSNASNDVVYLKVKGKVNDTPEKDEFPSKK